MCRTCVIISCNKRPSFGIPGGKRQHCRTHKEHGEINLIPKSTCEVLECNNSPSFAQPGEKRKRCSSHKITGDVNIGSQKCESPGCTLSPMFAQPGEKRKRCASHKIDGDINVVDKSCEIPGCPVRPHYAQPGEKRKRCASHKIDGDTNVVSKSCEIPGCPTRPNYAQPGEKSKRCGSHRIKGDINVVNITCETPGCPKQPSFAQPGEGSKRCADHRIEKDVDVAAKRCSSEACLFYQNTEDRGRADHFNPKTRQRDLCFNCHRSLHPELHKKLTVRKEQFILAEIQRQLPELEPHFLVWDCRLNVCTTKKPDMAWSVSDTLIHVEIDEGGENHEDNETRLVDIHAASGLMNHILIRFNPDNTEEGQEPCLKRIRTKKGDDTYRLYEPEWNRRIPVLIDSIKKAFDQSLENKVVNTKKRKLFF